MTAKFSVACCLPLYGDSEAAGIRRSMLGDFYYLGANLDVICDDQGWDKGSVELDPSPYPNSIEHARNNLVRLFLDHPRQYTHMWTRDSDVKAPSPTACARLVGKLLAADKPLIGVPYIQKAFFPKQAAQRVLELGPAPTVDAIEAAIRGFSVRYVPDPGMYGNLGTPDEQGLISFDEPPLGFALIRRDMLEKMWAHYVDDPRLAYEMRRSATADTKAIHEQHVGLFHTDIRDRVYKSEDTAFCQRWKAMGGRAFLYVGDGAPLEHIGYTSFKGTREALLSDWTGR